MKKFQIELNEDELIILSDWLARYNARSNESFRDQAEQRVLWDLDCQLEKLNEFLFSDAYEARLREAYQRTRDETK